MDEKQLKIAEKVVEEFFEKMTFEVQLLSMLVKDDTLFLGLSAKEPQILIGERGKTLLEIQGVLGKVLRKKIKDKLFLDLDINQYKESKTNYLKDLARDLADQVVLERREKILPPMSAYERRLVHLILAERGDIQSESIGQDPERRVVIKPV